MYECLFPSIFYSHGQKPIEAPCSNLLGIFDRKDFYLFLIRSLFRFTELQTESLRPEGPPDH